MANESQYYAPAVQAMIASLNNFRQGQELEQRKIESKAAIEHQKQQEAEAQRQLDIHEKQVEYEREHASKMADIAAEHQKLLHDEAAMNAISQGRALSIGGVDLSKLKDQLPGLFTGRSTEGGPAPNVDFSAFPTPAAEAARVASQAGQVAGAEAGARFPYEQSLEELQFGHKKTLQQQEQEFHSNLTDKELASKERMAKLERDTQLAIANAANLTHLRVAGMDPNYTPNLDRLKAMQIAFATGQSKPNLANPLEGAAIAANQALGFRDIDSKEIEALKSGQQLIPLFQQLRSFANELPSSQAGAFVKGHALGAANAVGWPTETQNKLNNINAQALNVGRAVEGLTGGRVLSKQLELDLNSLASGGITKEQALSRLDNLQNLYTNKQENTIFGGMNPQQKDLIYKTYGIKPSFILTAPKTNAKGHTLDEENSMRYGQPVYKE